VYRPETISNTLFVSQTELPSGYGLRL